MVVGVKSRATTSPLLHGESFLIFRALYCLYKRIYGLDISNISLLFIIKLKIIHNNFIIKEGNNYATELVFKLSFVTFIAPPIDR